MGIYMLRKNNTKLVKTKSDNSMYTNGSPELSSMNVYKPLTPYFMNENTPPTTPTHTPYTPEFTTPQMFNLPMESPDKQQFNTPVNEFKLNGKKNIQTIPIGPFTQVEL